MYRKVPHSNEISLFHNPDCSKAKKAKALAGSMASSVNSYEFSKMPKLQLQWHELLESLGKKAKDILDKSKPYYQANIRGRDFQDTDWLNILINNPDLIRSPIAIKGSKAMLLDNPSDILKI